MLSYTHQITDPAGFHARPVGLFVKLVSGFTSSIVVEKGDKKADGKRLFALMTLAAKQGETLVFSVEGADEESEMTQIKAFCETSV